jgi:hypothetical protein
MKALIKINPEEAKHLENCLSVWGSKRKFAKIIGKSESHITTMFRPIKVYNIMTREWDYEYRMLESEHKALIKFIEKQC